MHNGTSLNETTSGHKSLSFAGTKIKLSSVESFRISRSFFSVEPHRVTKLPSTLWAVLRSGSGGNHDQPSRGSGDSWGVDPMMFPADGPGKSDFSPSLFSSAPTTLSRFISLCPWHKWDLKD